MKVKIYGSEGCGFCNAAISLALDKELDYEYIDCTYNMIEFSKLFPGVKSVPQITIDDTWIGGYRDFAEVMETI
jgi:glutaredoxin 1